MKRLLLASGSLKAVAEEYKLSYPTVRSRLDRLIAKVRAAEDPKITDAFHRKLQIMVADGLFPISVARKLLDAHREALQKERG